MTERELELTGLLAESLRQNEVLRQEQALLGQKVDALVRRIFGSRSEQLDPTQLHRFLQGPQPGADPVVRAAPPPAPKAPGAARSANKPRLPENLPVVEEVIEPDVVKTQRERHA